MNTKYYWIEISKLNISVKTNAQINGYHLLNNNY